MDATGDRHHINEYIFGLVPHQVTTNLCKLQLRKSISDLYYLVTIFKYSAAGSSE